MEGGTKDITDSTRALEVRAKAKGVVLYSLSHMFKGPPARGISPDNICECIITELTARPPKRLRPQQKQSPQAVARRGQGTNHTLRARAEAAGESGGQPSFVFW